MSRDSKGCLLRQKYGTQLYGCSLFEQKLNLNNSALFVPPCWTQIVRQRRPERENKYGSVCMQLVLSQSSHLLHCTAMDVGDNNEMGEAQSYKCKQKLVED